MTHHLFSPIKLGQLTLKHRVAMAPLTRSRAGQPGNVPPTSERRGSHYAVA